ncbi:MULTISPECIES: pyridoxal kinase PdxY [unclassified Gilliamella]|uniref:pyridoxal kinase PdxY n=1 Tax=unclassified Gilliamella TaxID=2685620 RepID=UPI00226AA2E4|nr:MULTISPECIES: pyridoxal kinase PdxY [unclassified Gilliamella]MCX8601554.1 pyridoxal kinase PdxY [Gilliamella sp. B3722]MCX8608896.1 pyridoxal kinase PdxY [Gilliamella sp. B3771]MCX8610794.1 pyridoxal kinase PdxY [Gilliamella sp. B3891]MCX8613247.1 pyridoxal kinase PdxY [Gilliamella sp. B3773]MCX8614571.1 pyridoxal kinase PdxY [Gilliamella sp. B3770]
MKNILSIQSHVVFGHAGNSAAVFPMRRLGVNVWPLNTVQFSNHTQYRQWTGTVMPASHLTEIVDGINAIDELKHCDAILSGYMGSPEQGNAIIEIVKKVKAVNPNAVYLCDPVMGHPEKGCFVAPGVAEFLCNSALPMADMMAPNILELEELNGKQQIKNVDEAVVACRELCKKGPKAILVKHLSRAGYRKDRFEMLLVTEQEAWHIERPLVDFGERQPVGVGDMTSGLFLANILLGKSLVEALEHTTSAVYAVMLETLKREAYELQLVAAQNEIETPNQWFKAKRID